MGLFESLPDGPLKRPQVEKLERMQAVQGTYAVYNQQDKNTAYGVVILLNGTLRAWGYKDPEGWVEIDTKELDMDDPSEFDDFETVEAFRDEIADEIDAILV